mmetsp:Transcript_23163/g.36214  ORF Transcript_23163/g.36214 Transcript_23163/m.36214 type:complete len:81 (-) Transcript_23163:6316-6558(-)
MCSFRTSVQCSGNDLNPTALNDGRIGSKARDAYQSTTSSFAHPHQSQSLTPMKSALEAIALKTTTFGDTNSPQKNSSPSH